jgi:hypothetical protein
MFSLLSCAYQSAIELPPLTVTPEPAINCDAVYPKGKWQFVHSIAFSMADGKKGTAIGVSVLEDPVIQSALMTIEGFVLFEAALDGQLEITRAVPPFDNLDFARGLMQDLQLIFFRPASNKMQYGKLAGGSPLCRYQEASGESTDVVLFADHGWEINHYDAKGRRTRTIKARPQITQNLENQWLPPKQLELQANGILQYTLKMDLISSENF